MNSQRKIIQSNWWEGGKFLQRHIEVKRKEKSNPFAMGVYFVLCVAVLFEYGISAAIFAFLFLGFIIAMIPNGESVQQVRKSEEPRADSANLKAEPVDVKHTSNYFIDDMTGTKFFMD